LRQAVALPYFAHDLNAVDLVPHLAILGEGGAQLGDQVQRHAMLDIFIRVDDDVAFLRRDQIRDDLVLELAGFLRGFRLILGAVASES